MITSEDMLIDTVDDQDNPIGIIKRSLALPLRSNFRVVHLLLFNQQGDLLLQQLGFGRERHPGAWGSSVAAYVASGETYVQAAQRRLPEELGITTPLHALGKTSMNDEGSTKFIMLYTGIADGPFNYDHEHITRLEFCSIPEIVTFRQARTRTFTPTFLHVLDFYQQHR